MISCIIGVAASWVPNCHGFATSQRAIVRNRHSNERRMNGISHVFQLCSQNKWERRLILTSALVFPTKNKNIQTRTSMKKQNASCYSAFVRWSLANEITIRFFRGTWKVHSIPPLGIMIFPPGRVKHFSWLAMHKRCWTAARHQRHGL